MRTYRRLAQVPFWEEGDFEHDMGRQILIVDDELHTRALVAFILQRSHFTVLEANDGLSALSLLETTTPDLIILDIMMPGIDGLELCRRIRERPQTANTPIVIFSARQDMNTMRVRREIGADAYLPKMTSPNELTGKINQLLGLGGNGSAL